MTINFVTSTKTTRNNASPSVDTSGGTLLVAYAGSYTSTVGMSDNKGNTWTGLTKQSFVIDGQMFYVNSGSPTVGAGHTFTSTGSVFQGVCILCFSGSATSPLDQQSGNTANASSTIQPGSITSTTDYVNICGVAFNSNNTNSISGGGFSTVQEDQAYAPGNNIGAAIAYDISDGSASNPTWTHGDITLLCSTIASFKVAAGGDNLLGAIVL